MFLCKNCLKKEKVKTLRKLLLPKSYGLCELCGIKTICYDWKNYKQWFK